MTSSLFDSDLDSKITLERESTPLPEDMPFRLLIMGDWGGNSKFSTTDLSQRQLIEIDRDEFDGVMRRISPTVSLKFQDNDTNPLNLTFESLDDFHPDNIFQQVSLFADLRDIRQKLKKSETFESAAREVRSWYQDSKAELTSEKDISDSVKPADILEQGNILDQILDNKSNIFSTAQITPKTELSEFVSNIISPHIVKTNLEEQSKLLAIVDEVISDLMRKILHHKEFQKLESSWRGLYFLVRRIDTNNKLKLFFVQLSKKEMSDNLSGVNNLADSTLFSLIVGDSLSKLGKSPWAAVCGNYEFSTTVDDIAALIRLSKIAEAGNCPFISQIKPNILGIESFADFSKQGNLKLSDDSNDFKLWTALRLTPESSYLGLAMPRFIARIPYGYNTEPTEVFSFEEFTEEFAHDDYLWLNPCFAYAFALAQAYSRNEWNINQDTAFHLDDLPLHIFQYDGNTQTKSCAEIDMTEKLYSSIVEQGVMPLISFRNSDKIRLSALRSVSLNKSSLSGKWNG